MKNLKLRAQDAYLALYPQSKKPVDVNWPDEGKSREQALAKNGNLGLLLGSKSDVMDVDLDCREAKCLAELILPTPFAQFDRGRQIADTIFIRPPLVDRRRSLLAMALNRHWPNYVEMVLKQ